MRAAVGQRVRVTTEVTRGTRPLTVGTKGTVVIVHDDPEEAYLVDLDSHATSEPSEDNEAESCARRMVYTVLYPGEFEPIGGPAPPK